MAASETRTLTPNAPRFTILAPWGLGISGFTMRDNYT